MGRTSSLLGARHSIGASFRADQRYDERHWSGALPAMTRARKHLPAALLAALLSAIAFLWATPFLWTLVASFRPESAGSADMASLVARPASDPGEFPQRPR